jgi:L-threonylcarbamoyladenylate synthase
MAAIGKDINKAKLLLEAGELVGIPTETVYGLAGNALSNISVTKIFQVKDRPAFDPLIVHVPGIDHIKKYASDIPQVAHDLAERFWPGPLTLLFEKKPIIPDLVTSGMSTVGLRCPDHELTRSLLLELDFPLSAPSANPFGYVSPTKAEHVNEQLGSKIQYILEGGDCQVGIESTIIGFEDGKPIIYRLGGLDSDAIEKVTGKLVVQPYSSSNPKAPGQLKSHYAPRAKVVLGDLKKLLQQYTLSSTGVLSFNQNFEAHHQFILSPSGTIEEAAHNLFSGLRHFDKLPVDVVLAELVPDVGIGRAINDRLRRAAAV